MELNSAAILETAATISALDLIISADTMGSWLAGAFGKPGGCSGNRSLLRGSRW